MAAERSPKTRMPPTSRSFVMTGKSPKTAKTTAAKNAKAIAAQSAKIGEYAAEVLVAAKQLRIKSKLVDHFLLSTSERAALATLTMIPQSLKKRLPKKESQFTVAEAVGLIEAVALEVPSTEPAQQFALLIAVRSLMDCLSNALMGSQRAVRAKLGKSAQLFQFKVTLKDSKPPIWRRIQVQDCTLDDFHFHIQAAMGWTNSHLHQFEIEGRRYGDPELLDEGFADFACLDSTMTKLSDVVPVDGKRFRFRYEYDFGDGWIHEILFEGNPPSAKGQKYPLCLEGARACPPEDVGGVWGYAEFLDALSNPKHEQHAEMLEWSGPFDPEPFDLKKATKEMQTR